MIDFDAAREWIVNGTIALAGGLLRFLQAWRKNMDWKPVEIALEASISILAAGFAGVLTFLLMRAKGFDSAYTGFAVGIMGHMGVEGIAYLRSKVGDFFTKTKKGR